MTPNLPRRHALKEGSLSTKPATLLRQYADDLALRYAERTVPEYVAHVRAFLGWLDARSLSAAGGDARGSPALPG